MKYFSLKVICEDHGAIKHGQAYVVGTITLCVIQQQVAVHISALLVIQLVHLNGPAHKHMSAIVILHSHHCEHAC